MIKILFSCLFVSFVAIINLNAKSEVSCCKEELIHALSQESDIRNLEKIGSLYHKHRYQLLWRSDTLHQLLNALHDKRLNYTQRMYHQDRLQVFLELLDRESISHEDLALLDILASDTYLSFSKDLSVGRIDETKFQTLLHSQEAQEYIWEKRKKIPNYMHELELALKTGLVDDTLERYPPQELAYQRLIDAYHQYKTKSFPKIDYLKDLKLGDYGYEVSQLKKYLVATGDLKDVDAMYIEFPTFDEKLQNAVISFQKRHYLKQNGIFDRVNALYARRTAYEKLQQIESNIERYKLFPRIESSEYCVINIPAFSLKYYQDKTLVKDIFVVIGREDRPTPIFKDALEYIVLNPTWSIPQNLMKKDYISHLISDPESLLDKDIHIYQDNREIDPRSVQWKKYLHSKGNIPFRMVQKAGDTNVLGQMKFIFPNPYNVYLHDTNAKQLTTRRYRLYSSGCIRLSKPYELLALLSPLTGYSFEQLIDIIESKKTKHIKLNKKIPIHIRYLTVFVDENAQVNFRKDFYGFDKILNQALQP